MTTDATTKKTTAELLFGLIASGMEPITSHVPSTEGQQPCMIVPNDCAIESLEQFMPFPARVRERIVFTSIDSFLKYWNRFKMGSSVIFADDDALSFLAIFDYHVGSGLQDAMNCDHAAAYSCPVSKEWRTWTGGDGKKKSQTEFALFIEDNIDCIGCVGPDGAGVSGADMLQIATALEVKNKIQFKSSQRLDNGEIQLTYNEDIDGTDRTGNMKIPQEFYLAIPVFKNDDPYVIKARLRYRMASGNIVFWYDLYRTDKVLDDAFDRVYKEVEKVAGEGNPIYLGNR